MPRKQPTTEDLLSRFDSEVSGVFYEVFIIQSIQKLGQPSIAEVRAAIAKLANGKFVRSEASDKQLIGRMDTTFGLIDCVGGSGLEKRYRLNAKGKSLLDKTTEQVIEPVVSIFDQASG